ncbi:MAG: TIGR02996 domain-containing protein [Labilithrix sp.]|nr:TIGR02996 domain-containing protein [Labilithrix sp.]MCW5816757.1 TIGR02996 domain-containing protein [Labilithrix sp.]
MIAEMKQVATALEEGRTVEALDALLDAWREKRAPQLADAIDALAPAFPPPSPALEGHAWTALARAGNAGDLFALLATLLEAGPIGTLGGRIEQLVERPDDPRIAMALAKLALDPPTTSSANFPIWTKIFASLAQTGDARVVPILQERLRTKGGESKFWPKLTSGLERVLKKIPAAPELSKQEEAAVAAVVRAAKTAKPAKTPAPAKAPSTAAPSGDPLARAIAAVEADDLPACVEALLEAWREARLAELAAAIDRVTALHDEGVACPGGDDKGLQKAWLELAAKKRPIDVGRLADAAGDRKAGDAEKRLEEMLAWPADPRVARAMYLHCAGSTFSDRTRSWGLVADLLVKNVDVRLAPNLGWFTEVRGDNKARRAALRRAGPAALKVIAGVPTEPTSDERRALERLGAALDAWDAKRLVTERKLLEAILAAPKEDGPRLVYADWLTERGHPRGELIVLQTSAAPDRDRIAALYAQHARALLGPVACVAYRDLAYALSSKGIVLDRGLVKEIELRNAPPAWFFEGHPLFWFIEEIEPQFEKDDAAAAVIASSRSLRVLHAQPSLAARVAERESPRSTLEELRLGYSWQEREPLPTVLARLPGIGGRGLSKVKHLELFWSNGMLHQDGIPEALVTSPLFDALETMTAATTNLASVIAALRSAGRKVKTLSFLRRHYDRYRLDVELDADLAPTALTVRPVEGDVAIDERSAASLLQALRSLTLPPTTKLTVSGGVTFDDAARAAVAALVTL